MDKKEDLKVLHVSTPLTWRGGEQQVFYLMSELKKKGIRQVLFCPEHSELGKRAVEKEFLVTNFVKRSGLGFLAARQLRLLVVKENITIIHVHDAQAHTMCVLAASIFRLKVPIVLNRRVDFPIKKRWFTLYKYNHPQIKRIICVSDAIRKIVAPTIKEPKSAVTIHSGIDLSRFEKPEKGKLRALLNLPAETILVGNVAAIADHKDYPTFLKTVQILSQTNPDLRFIIMGDGPLKTGIEKLCDALGLTKSVFFTGFRNDIPELLPDLSAFLFTSKTEGLGTSILDAFAAGVPVVATNAGGIPELVMHKKTGLLADVGDAETLAKNVRQIIEKPELAASLKYNAGEHLKEFTKEHTAKMTADLYREVLLENR
jgi:glycosyltransferase involved in cell wall biosynthesis